MIGLNINLPSFRDGDKLDQARPSFAQAIAASWHRLSTIDYRLSTIDPDLTLIPLHIDS